MPLLLTAVVCFGGMFRWADAWHAGVRDEQLVAGNLTPVR